MALPHDKFIEFPRSALILSVVIHMSVPIFFSGISFLDHSGMNIFSKKRRQQELYQAAIQVDVVALPEQLINQKFEFDPSLPVSDKPMEAKPNTTATDTDLTDISSKLEERRKLEKETKLSEQNEKLRQQEQIKALKLLESEARRERALKGLAKLTKEKASRPKLSGNIPSKGTATAGRISSDPMVYGDLVRKKIHECFDIYEWQNKKDLIANVHFELLPNGRVTNVKITSPSTNPLYDSAVKKSLLDCQPYPLPEDLSILGGGFTVTFKPQE